MRAAIIGLGLIGSAWAEHLRADKILSAVWNRSAKLGWPEAVAKLRDIPKSAEILHIVVSDEKAALCVVKEMLPELTSMHLIVQSTTIDPATSEELCTMVRSKGAKYLEAPFTGSLPAAKQRKTVFYLGADEPTISAALPYLSHLSEKKLVLGEARHACAVKLALNLHAAAIVEAIAEGLNICRKTGVKDDAFFSALRENAGFSALAALKEPKFRNSDFAPQFAVKHLAKDMRLLSNVADGSNYPLLEQIRSVLASAEAKGLAEEDYIAVAKVVGD